MQAKLKICLFFLRLSVALVFAVWTIDKLIRPDHAAAVFEGFYGLSSIGDSAMKFIAIIEILILIGFLIGIKKRLTYGIVLVLHTISTLSSYKQYLYPFEKMNLLFFAAWPMLAACVALYLLRDEDTLFTFPS